MRSAVVSPGQSSPAAYASLHNLGVNRAIVEYASVAIPLFAQKLQAENMYMAYFALLILKINVDGCPGEIFRY